MCSLIAHVEDGKIVRVQGDPDHPYTAGFTR
jgi:anaerobic selenocysteine-containing dehydrogenase